MKGLKWTQISWSFVLGVLALFVFLLWLGWTSRGSAEQMAADQTKAAVVAYATPACVARFERQPNAVAAWKELKGIQGYNQGDAIEKGGWVAEPDQKLDSAISRTIASECASKVLELKTIGNEKLPTE